MCNARSQIFKLKCFYSIEQKVPLTFDDVVSHRQHMLRLRQEWKREEKEVTDSSQSLQNLEIFHKVSYLN